MAGPTVLAIILNYRTPDLTLRAAEATLREMDGIAGEVVVVDNASGDGSFERLTAEAEARGWTGRGLRVLSSGRNGGYGAGNNFGMRAGLSNGSPPDYVYILNPDAVPGPGSIRCLLDHLEAEADCGIAGSYIHGPDGDWHCTCFRFPTIAGEFEGAARIGAISRLLAGSRVPRDLPEAASEVDWLAGASVMMRRAMLDRIGAFDEGFFLYFEETDLCRRAWDAGWRVTYVPESRVAHLGSASTGMKEWRRVPEYWFASRHRYFVKTHGRAYAAAATAARVAGQGLWALKRLITRQPPADPPHFTRDLIRHALAPSRSRPAGETLQRREA